MRPTIMLSIWMNPQRPERLADSAAIFAPPRRIFWYQLHSPMSVFRCDTIRDFTGSTNIGLSFSLTQHNGHYRTLGVG
jgi:hypothetical protein